MDVYRFFVVLRPKQFAKNSILLRGGYDLDVYEKIIRLHTENDRKKYVVVKFFCIGPFGH